MLSGFGFIKPYALGNCIISIRGEIIILSIYETK